MLEATTVYLFLYAIMFLCVLLTLYLRLFNEYLLEKRLLSFMYFVFNSKYILSLTFVPDKYWAIIIGAIIII
jgi:hypothetical protein